MSFLLEPLQYEFIQRGMIAAVLVGIVCAVVGSYVVLRGMAFFGDALAHTILPGIALGYLITGGARDTLFWWALGTAIVAALGIGAISKQAEIKEDTAIGIIFAGMFALDHNRPRIADDHANARAFAEALSQVAGLRVDLTKVQTNIVMVDVERGTIPAWIELAREQGVLLGANTVSARPHTAPNEVVVHHQIRAVCHLDVSREDVMRAAGVIAEIASKL